MTKMKDEEIAEEWWNSWIVKDWNDLQEGKKLFIQAFIAGLKINRQDNQLSKAKKLIEGWLSDFYNPKAFYQQRAELVEQSEQFLQEVGQDLNEGLDLDKTAEDKENIQSNTSTGTAIKSEPRKWNGWKDKDYISGRI